MLPRHRNRKRVGREYQNSGIYQNYLFHLITSRLRASRNIPLGPRKITDDPIGQNTVPRMICARRPRRGADLGGERGDRTGAAAGRV